jgi:PIN domain nuclease of toxin-antitoxin system
MESAVTTVLLDSHVLHWWSAEPERLRTTATEAVSSAEELAVASITWFELAWLAEHDPADRLIHATAVEHGWQLVTKDGRLRKHRDPRPLAVW